MPLLPPLRTALVVLAVSSLALLCVSSASASGLPSAAAAASASSARVGERLLFSDEFDELNNEVWEHELTLGGGGNWEFQVTHTHTAHTQRWHGSASTAAEAGHGRGNNNTRADSSTNENATRCGMQCTVQRDRTVHQEPQSGLGRMLRTFRMFVFVSLTICAHSSFLVCCGCSCAVALLLLCSVLHQ